MTAPVVIVGASMAGLRSAEQLRAHGWTGPITVIGDEPYLPYNRPPLSKNALTAHWGDAAAWQQALAFRHKASVADVDWRLGLAAEAADLDASAVQLADGTELRYSGLVVATGLRPQRLRLPGPQVGRHVLRTLDDAHALSAELTPGQRVVVLGGGFIGCEIAATATAAGCSTSIVEPLPALLQGSVGNDVGRAVSDHHEARGVRVLCGHRAAALHPSTADHGRIGAVELQDGSSLPADLVVEAVGSQPNVEWLGGNGLDLTDGVLCDRWLRVEGRPTVVAAGDVVRVRNPRFDDIARRVEHWCTPLETARQAGASLARTLLHGDPGQTAFAPLPSFWSDQHDLRVQSYGMLAAADNHQLVDGDLNDLTSGITVHFHQGERLVGVLLINAVPREHREQRELVDAACQAPAAEPVPVPTRTLGA